MDEFLTQKELKIALAVHALRGQGYGVSIRDFLKENSETRISIAALYATLDRLEQRRLVEARWGEKTPERGGRRKKYFRLTGEGAQVMAHSLGELERLRAAAGAGVMGVA